MSKKIKILIIILAVPVILIVAGMVFAKLYFTSERLKALIIPRVEEATHRKVSVGDVSLSFIPRFAVTMERLTISAPEGQKFDREEFLSLDELLLDVNLFALLKDRVEIDEIVLTRPKLYIEVNQQGVANYSQPKEDQKIGVPPPATAQPSESPKAPLGLMLANFRVEDGEIDYIDKQANRRVRIQDYQQQMRAEVRGGVVFFESESRIGVLSYGSMKSFLIAGLPVVTYQRLTYRQSEDLLSLDSVAIAIRQIALVLKGTVARVQTAPSLNLTVASTKADIAQLLSLVPKEYMKTAEGISSTGTFQFSMNVKGEASDSVRPAVRGTFTVVNGSIRYPALPKSITNINVRGSFEQPPAIGKRKQAGKFALEKFSANLGSSTLGGSLGIVDFNDPTLSASFNGNLHLGEVKEYYPLEPGTEIAGAIVGDFSIGGKAKVQSSIKAAGRLEFKNVTFKTATSPRPLRNLNGNVAFNNQLIESKNLSMNIGESDMQLAFTLRNYLALVMEEAATSGKPSMLVTLTSRQLRTADLMSEEPSGAAGKQTPATKDDRMKQTALLPNMDVDANVSIGKLVTEKFEFGNARGSVQIRDGVITLQDFSVNVFQGTVVARGMLDARRVDRRPFDFNLEITGVEANAFLPKFTTFGNNMFGKFSMNTSVKGDLNDTLGLNTKTLTGQGNVQVFDGKLVGYPLTVKLADYTGVNELREVQFKNWSNAYTIADGRLHIKDLKVMTANTEMNVNGSQGFDGSLDYRMLVRLPESLSSKLRMSGVGAEVINLLKDDQGRVNLNFKVSGTTSDPVFALDTEEARRKAKEAVEQKARDEAERLKKKAEEELKKKAEEGLKKLFKRP